MLFELKYPTIVVAAKGSRVPTAFPILMTHAFNIAEYTADEAPIAAVIHDRSFPGGPDTVIRMLGGKLYRPISNVAEFDGFPADVPAKRNPYLRHFLDDLQDTAREGRLRRDRPKLEDDHLLHKLHHPSSGSLLESMSERLPKGTTPISAYDRDGDVNFIAFANAVASSVIVDGVVYLETVEPVFEISAAYMDTVSVVDGSVFAESRRNRPDSTDSSARTEVKKVHHPLTDPEGAWERARTLLGKEVGDPAALATIHDDSAFTANIARLDMDRTANAFSTTLLETLTHLFAARPGFLAATPTETLRTAMALRDRLSSYHPDDCDVPDDLPQLILAAAEASKPLEDMVGLDPADFLDKEIFADVVEAFENAPVMLSVPSSMRVG